MSGRWRFRFCYLPYVAAVFLCWCAVPLLASQGQTAVEKDSRITAVENLINRRFGEGVAAKFALEIIPPTDKGLDVLEIGGSAGPQIRLAGSSGTALASALYWYVKTVLKRQVSWDAKDPELPDTLPPVSTKHRVERITKYTYYQNVCTVSYSMWSWSWEEWERHLDWMALNGINLALAFTGQEFIWMNVFRDHFGISDDGIFRFFSGAAFLAWNRMGNIRGPWGPGSLPVSFVNDQHTLQMQILQRMHQLEITPVLPGFAGHVPEELRAKHAGANISLAPNWGNFPPENCCVRTLEPRDPLFHQIGELFVREQHKVYGSLGSSIYQMDTYNEMQPHSSALDYLQASSQAVFKAMRAGDPDGVWLMQGWLFVSAGFWSGERVKAYLSGVPDDGMMILDLYSEKAPQWRRTQSFFGKPWIYCVLHNFGGNLGLRGNLFHIASDVIAAFAESGGMVGVGLTMEGIFQNYVVYHLTLEMAWKSHPVDDVVEWVQEYAVQRYGGSAAAKEAWGLLAITAYNCSHGWGVTKSLIDLRPGFDIVGDKVDGFMPRLLPYEAGSMLAVWELWLAAAEADGGLQRQDAFLYDLVDVTRQGLSDIFFTTFQQATRAFAAKSGGGAVCALTLKLTQLITDMDMVLATHRGFLLGSWLDDAAALAQADEALADYFLYQARNQITRWGAEGEISDYASKQWAGLVGSYYGGRWGLWLSELCSAAREGRAFDRAGTAHALDAFEGQWQYGPTSAPSEPIGDTVRVSRTLWERYGGRRAAVGLDVLEALAAM